MGGPWGWPSRERWSCSGCYCGVNVIEVHFRRDFMEMMAVRDGCFEQWEPFVGVYINGALRLHELTAQLEDTAAPCVCTCSGGRDWWLFARSGG